MRGGRGVLLRDERVLQGPDQARLARHDPRRSVETDAHQAMRRIRGPSGGGPSCANSGASASPDTASTPAATVIRIQFFMCKVSFRSLLDETGLSWRARGSGVKNLWHLVRPRPPARRMWYH